jgi:hypothetical protein
VWLWGLLAAAGIFLWRKHTAANSAAAAATTATAEQTTCQDANGNTVDCNSLLAVNSEGQGEYEQLTSQLQGIQGSEAALAASIQQSQGSGSTGSGTTTTSSGTGTTTSSSGGTTTTGTSGGGTTTAPAPVMATIPVTFGLRADTAISNIQAAGFTVSTNPARNPKLTYQSIGSSPEGGRQAPKGSHVVLNVKQHTY